MSVLRRQKVGRGGSSDRPTTRNAVTATNSVAEATAATALQRRVGSGCGLGAGASMPSRETLFA